MKTLQLGYYLVSILLFGLLFSCKKKTFNVSDLDVTGADPSFALSLGAATLNLGDLEKEFDQGELIYNQNDELFRLIYRQELFEFDANELIDIPAQNIDYSIGIPPSIASTFNLAPTGTSVNYSETINETFTFSNGEELDSIIITSGSLDISALSEIEQDVEVILTIPYLLDGNTPFSTVLDLTYQGSPAQDDLNLDLSGLVLDLSKNGQTSNEIDFEVEVTITKTAQPSVGNETISFQLDFEIDEFNSVWGYFGNYQNIVATDTQNIAVFDDVLAGELHFADPKLNLYVYSTVGLSLGTSFNGLSGDDGQSIGGPGLTNMPVIPAAGFIGDTVKYTHVIDNTNTSPTLSDLIDNSPESIIYDFGAETNPNGIEQNFITNSSSAWGDIEVELPLFGYANNFSFQDTSDLDLSDALGLDEESTLNEQDVESATLRLISDNGLPLELGAQIYFLDENDLIIDSLFKDNTSPNIIDPGVIDYSLPVGDPNYGKVIESSRKIMDVNIDQEQLQNLLNINSKKIIYKARINTNNASQGQDVKFYPEYELRLKLSAKVNLNINLSN